MTYQDSLHHHAADATMFEVPVAYRGAADSDHARSADEGVPLLRHGRYAVDAALHRSNLTRDSASPRDVVGLPLYLLIRVHSTSTARPLPLADVQIEVQHCNALGRCSDAHAGHGRGAGWLHGYQLSDADGGVAFQTIYPGWQSGRAVNIDLVARYYDRAGHASFEFATTLWFDDVISDAVHARMPYAMRGPRRVRNADDAAYAARGAHRLALRQTGDHSPGWIGEIDLGLALHPGQAVPRCAVF